MKKTSNIVIALLLCSVVLLTVGAIKLYADNNADNTQSTPAESLINRLKKVQDNGQIIFGHHDDPVYGHTWVGDLNRSDVMEVVGDYPGMMSWDLGEVELQHGKNLDGVPTERITSEVIAQDARGGINTFSWHLKNPATGGDSWDCTDSLTVKKVITPGTPENDTVKVWMNRIADYLSQIKDKDGKIVPVIFRPWHEHNGSWFWWGRNFCTPEEYKELWKMTRKAFDDKGVTNVVWAYSPNIVETETEYLERCPDDYYFDLVGADVYQFNGEEGLDAYVKALNTSLEVATKVGKDKNKLVAFTETGSESVPMSDWWTSVLLPNIEKYPVCFVVVWRNAHDNPKHYYAPFPGQISEKSFIDFYNNPKVLFSKETAIINQ